VWCTLQTTTATPMAAAATRRPPTVRRFHTQTDLRMSLSQPADNNSQRRSIDTNNDDSKGCKVTGRSRRSLVERSAQQPRPSLQKAAAAAKAAGRTRVILSPKRQEIVMAGRTVSQPVPWVPSSSSSSSASAVSSPRDATIADPHLESQHTLGDSHEDSITLTADMSGFDAALDSCNVDQDDHCSPATHDQHYGLEGRSPEDIGGFFVQLVLRGELEEAWPKETPLFAKIHTETRFETPSETQAETAETLAERAAEAERAQSHAAIPQTTSTTATPIATDIAATAAAATTNDINSSSAISSSGSSSALPLLHLVRAAAKLVARAPESISLTLEGTAAPFGDEDLLRPMAELGIRQKSKLIVESRSRDASGWCSNPTALRLLTVRANEEVEARLRKWTLEAIAHIESNRRKESSADTCPELAAMSRSDTAKSKDKEDNEELQEGSALHRLGGETWWEHPDAGLWNDCELSAECYDRMRIAAEPQPATQRSENLTPEQIRLWAELNPSRHEEQEIVHEEGGDEAQDWPDTIVIDPGSSQCRIGRAGCELPDLILPSSLLVSSSSGRRCLADDADSIGDENPVALKLVCPLHRGVVSDWESLEWLWSHAFYDKMKIDPKCHRVLIAEPLLNPKVERERMASLLLTSLSFASVFVCESAALTTYAVGHLDILALELGHSVSTVMPIVQGYAIPHACQRSHFAGHDVTCHLANLLAQKGQHVPDGAHGLRLLQEVKEKYCSIPSRKRRRASLLAQERECGPLGPVTTALADGVSEVLLDDECQHCPEILFQGDHLRGLYGNHHKSVSELIFTSIRRCDMNLRYHLRHNICLFGGTTLTTGFLHRLDHDCQAHFGEIPPPKTWEECSVAERQLRLYKPKRNFKIVQVQNRDLAVFMGGTILGTLTTVSFAGKEAIGTSGLHGLSHATRLEAA